ncbi:MAG: beta-propeller fold lactonase family protein [Crocinitomicaceae bacterium]|nr:beta-propeller fold lactonase family protein [Crocinitomicaceae bacterium]
MNNLTPQEIIDSSEFPQLSFELNNGSVLNTVYITNDPSINKLTLVISTNVSETLTQATPVPKSDAGSASGSLLYLDLSSFNMTSEEFNQVSCTADGWAFQLYSDGIICLAPTADTTLEENSTINITIDGVTLISPTSSSANLNVTYYRVDPAALGTLPQVSTFKVMFQNAPSGGEDLHNVIGCQLSTPPYIINTVDGYPQVNNSLAFVFEPGPNPVEVPSGSDSKFILSFVYADANPGYGALTTVNHAVNIRVKQGENASAWHISPDTSSQNPSWTLIPPQGEPIIGTGVKSTVEIDVQDIITTFEPGPTMMFVQYQDIPGYADGSYYILLNKLPHVTIDSLTISPNPSVLENGKATLDISWDVKDAESLILLPMNKDVTGLTSTTVTIEKTELITLEASGSGSKANLAFKSEMANVLPVVNSFQCNPTSVYKGDFPHSTQFCWSVNTNDQVYLENDRTGEKMPISNNGVKINSIAESEMWSLIPASETDAATLRRNALIQGFDLVNATNSVDFAPSSIAASPTSQFIAASNKTGNSVSILNTLTLDNYVSALTVGASPIDVQFSNNGKYLFVACSGDSTLRIFNVALESSTGNYSFSVNDSIALEGSPVRITQTVNGGYVFVTCNDDTQGKLAVIKLSGTAFSLTQTIDVGEGADGITTDANGIRVFVANTTSKTISVIGYNGLSDEYDFVRNIDMETNVPSDLAISGSDQSTLLILCSSNSTVIAQSTTDQTIADAQTISVPGGAKRITTTVGNSYAFVTCSTTNEVSLIGCYDGVGKCELLTSIETTAAPVSISSSYDGNLLFVSGSSSNIAVINLAKYQMQSQPVTTVKSYNGVAASPDGANVMTWYNTLLGSGTGSPANGISIYNTASETSSSKLDSDVLIQCMFSTDIPTTKAYAIMKDTNNITILNATSFASESMIPIPDSGANKQYPLAIAMDIDQANLFVLTMEENTKACNVLIFKANVATNSYTLSQTVNVYTASTSSDKVLMKISQDGTSVVVCSAYQSKLWKVGKSASGTYELNGTEVGLSLIPKAMAISPDNQTAYVLLSQNLSSAIAVIDLSTMVSTLQNLPASYATIVNFNDLCVSPDNQTLFMTDTDVVGIRLVDASSLRIVQTLTWNSNVEYPVGISILPNASAIYFAGQNSGTLGQIIQY